MTNPFDDAPIIYAYTRAQAIEDGELIDVSTTAQEAGIKLPVALTRGVWGSYITVPESVRGLQDEKGRLWDIVWMLLHALPRGSRALPFEFRYTVQVANTRGKAKPVQLKAHIGAGDDGTPVITVLLPEED